MARKVCRVSSRKLAAAARKERREHPWTSAAQARRIARDHLCETASPQWRVRKREIGGWWAEFLPPGRKRWIPMLGAPFRSRDAAESAVRMHKVAFRKR